MKIGKGFLALITTMTLLVYACSQQEEQKQIVRLSDVDIYLNTAADEALQVQKAEYSFWQSKYNDAPDQFMYQAKMAKAQSAMFELTGEIDLLVDAGQNLEQVNNETSLKHASYLRSLARNYISQHRFKEALEYLKLAEDNGERLSLTHKMLFDVHLELADVPQAKEYLAKFRNREDFDFLIRMAKLKDHEGDLTSAIDYMERAMRKAENSKNKALMQWAYTNLADFYGHDGRISNAYQYYLKALELDPLDAYAKKGIAWIAFSHDRNTALAKDIISTIMAYNATPDYHLMLAEIAEFEGNEGLSQEHTNRYFSVVGNERYGDMYNRHKSILLAENFNQPNKAMALARQEINQRPTPGSYSLLAWSLYNNGEEEMALDVVDTYIAGKSFEPDIQYQMAAIYKANELTEKSEEIKQDLLASVFELGPVMEQRILDL